MADEISRRKWLELASIFGVTALSSGLLYQASGELIKKPKKKLKKAKRVLRPNNKRFVYRGYPLSYLVGQKIITALGKYDNMNVLEPFIETKKLIRDYKIGGLIYMNNTDDIRGKKLEEISELSEYFQSLSRFPLIIAADNEGGRVNKIRHIVDIPSAEHYGKLYLNRNNRSKVLKELKRDARMIHEYMAKAGMNLNLAPCLDTVKSFESPYGCIEKENRSYGMHPRIISDLGGAFLETRKNVNEGKIKNILNCAKHFVGEGASVLESDLKKRSNSHQNIGILPSKQDFFHHAHPFRHAIQNHDVESIMLGFVKTAFDPKHPSAMSHVITQWLRVQYGFKGLLITDDLMMIKELNKYPEKLDGYLAKAMNAGVDQFLTTDPHQVKIMRDKMIQLVVDGVVPFDKVKVSFDRIMAAKKKIGYEFQV